MTKQSIIYVPGIGDNRFGLQNILIKSWAIYGVKGICHPMPWQSQETYQAKMDRLIAEIDKYLSKSYKVSLLGASAGASAVLNAFVQRRDKISSVVCVCGKINGPEYVERSLYNAQPGFEDSLLATESTLPKLTQADKAKMLSLFSPKDDRVPYKATTVPGIREAKLPSLSHVWAIVYALTFGAPGITKFIKSA